ncbi:MAG: hypothetical protein K0U98_11205 [Deltaproteobacteria bacterium]|nr:hypothetical protein [Deltaproteobacteria bacterium]
MFLTDVIAALESEIGTGTKWISAILVVVEGSGEIVEFPIFEVELEELDPEVPQITLSTDQEAGEPRPLADGLSSEELLEKLRDLQPRCSEYQVFSRSAVIFSEGDTEVRACSPLVGHATNPLKGVFGLLQGPMENWNFDRSS